MRLWQFFFPSLINTTLPEPPYVSNPYLISIKVYLMVPFLQIMISLFKQSTGYSIKSNHLIFLVPLVPQGWEHQDDRKNKKWEMWVQLPYQRCLEEGGHKSKGTWDLPISVTLSWVHLCQKSSELSAACQASKRFLEKILLHIPKEVGEV